MGRSVYVPHEASSVKYFPLGDVEDWDDIVDDVRHVIRANYPSLLPVNDWFSREGQTILQNGHARVVLSNYGGLVAVALVPHDTNIARTWCDKVGDAFFRPADELVKLGTMSNGESVYKPVNV